MFVMKKRNLLNWIQATRPWSFTASASPVLLTLLYLTWIKCDVNWIYGICAIALIIIFHAAGNTWSDYNDFKHNIDTETTSGAKSITSGEFKAEEIRSLSLGLLTVGLIGGLALTWFVGWPLLVFGAIGALLTILYPKMKFNALGDVDIFLCYTLLPTLGTSFLATGAMEAQALWATIPSGLITVAILHINNMRDMKSDYEAGIRTIPLIIGYEKSITLYLAETFLPYVLLLVCIPHEVMSWWSLIVFLSAPLFYQLANRLVKAEGYNSPELKQMDELTAKFQLVFSLLLVIALILAIVKPD